TAVVSDVVREALLQVIGREQMTSVVQDIQQKATSLQEARELAPPQIAELPQRIFLGSIGATVTVPFNYQWTWSAGTGSPSIATSADRTTGRMSFSLFGNFSNSSSVSAAVALGIYFRPMVTNGILRLFANPGFTYRWSTFGAFRRLARPVCRAVQPQRRVRRRRCQSANLAMERQLVVVRSGRADGLEHRVPAVRPDEC